MKTGRFTLFILLCAVALSFFIGFKKAESDYFFKIGKSIDIFGKVYREVALNYVDEVDPEKFMASGIDGMLGTLDPYTNYISESEADEVELITTGKYGGIGVTIGVRDGFITIMTVMDGYSAQRQGLLPGDRVLAVDGTSVVGKKPDDVRALTRGDNGTEVRLKVEREGEPKPLEFVLVREEIQLKNLSFADYVGDGIGYAHIERFTRGAGDELRLAIKDLQLRGQLKGFILDLRDNPGGLLDVAVDVVEKFAPKGSLIVSTRGRRPETEKKYYGTEEPMVPDVPLIVLTNRGSASASEIVAGALQDLDRAVIMGTRSFGKGLVQTIAPLPYNGQLKMTTAKYYTPSGRCIQEIDYQHHNGVLAVTPESLRHQFKTVKGRIEYEAGGITPDSTVSEPDQGPYLKELFRKSMIFKYATTYAAGHKDSSVSVSDDELVSGFGSYLTAQKFTYQDEGDLKVGELADLSTKAHYSQAVLDAIDKLKSQLAAEKSNALDRNRTEVARALRLEIISRYRGEKGRTLASLPGDVQLQAAKSLLLHPKAFKALLSVKH